MCLHPNYIFTGILRASFPAARYLKVPKAVKEGKKTVGIILPQLLF